MKNSSCCLSPKIWFFFMLMLIGIQKNKVYADGGVVAYYKVTVLKATMAEAAQLVEKALVSAEDLEQYKIKPFTIVGQYNPTRSSGMLVISFTREDLIELTGKIGGKAILASVLKVGLQELKNQAGKPTGEIMVSLLNPDYLFYAYIRNKITSENESALATISEDAKFALYSLPNANFFPLITSTLTENELKSFRFMVSYPGFDEDVHLQQFNSFDEGVNVILENLRARKNGTYNVYTIVPSDLAPIKNERSGEVHRLLPPGCNTALFGIGLPDEKIGEAKFLPILGEEHITALPYEIVLENTEALMLNGRFRFPLFWSDVSMHELRQIYKTPRDIQEAFTGLTSR